MQSFSWETKDPACHNEDRRSQVWQLRPGTAKKKKGPEGKRWKYLISCSHLAWVCAQSVNCVPLFATPWILACQASLPIGFSRQECWSGLPFPLPGDLADRAWVSCISSIGRQILYHWATREALPTWQRSSDLWLMLYLSSNRSCSKLLKMEMTRKVKCQALFYQVK